MLTLSLMATLEYEASRNSICDMFKDRSSYAGNASNPLSMFCLCM